MKAEQIAKAIGTAHRSGKWWRCICPVHGSRTGDSTTLAVRDGDRGLIVVCHAGCPAAAVVAELQKRGLVGRSTAVERAAAAPSSDNRSDTASRIASARRVLDGTEGALGTPVQAHFLGRGLEIVRFPCVRYARSLRRPDGSYGPAMVAPVLDLEGRLLGVHRTWLEQDDAGTWRRRDRATLGPIRGGAVQLAPAAWKLMVGEGIESCAAPMQATGIPAWAALSTSGLKSLILPPLVQHVIILADNDGSGAGQRAAQKAAHRWIAEGRRVQITMPLDTGTDMADVLVGRAPMTEAHYVAA
jgi:hypothetical protein